MTRIMQSVIDTLKVKSGLIYSRKVTIGFDGFLDSIVQVVKYKLRPGENVYFENISDFGAYLSERDGKSCSLELEEKALKIGGNMPIMANALGSLNVKVNCIGAMGFPKIHPAFEAMSENCSLYSFTAHGVTTALEFNDGKVMLANFGSMHEAGWSRIKDTIGLERIITCFRESDLTALVNWSELDCTNDIWEGIIREVLPEVSVEKNRILFFDLADCSKRGRQEMEKAFSLMKQFNNKYRVILGLNDNEALLLYRMLLKNGTADTCEAGGIITEDASLAGSIIYRELGIDVVVIHTPRYSIAWDGNSVSKVNTRFVEKPTISTGGGDNFNAGFCLGLLLGMDIYACQLLANSVSGYYISKGKSPSLKQLIEYMESNQDE